MMNDRIAELERQHEEDTAVIADLSKKADEIRTDLSSKLFARDKEIKELEAQIRTAHNETIEALNSAAAARADASYWRGVAVGIDCAKAEAAQDVQNVRRSVAEIPRVSREPVEYWNNRT